MSDEWRLTRDQVDAMLVVPSDDEKRRGEIAESVVAALEIVREFANRNGWSEHMRAPYFTRVEIFTTREALWRRLLELTGTPADTPMPTDGLTAALENDVLVAVVREEAQRVRPEYFASQEDWTRALAHEIVHRLHVRILHGNEEAMGPPWFFEGFAVFGSGQQIGADIQVATVDQVLELAHAEGRGAYAKYAAAVRFLAAHATLPELIAHAGTDDFEGWLRSSVIAGP